MSNGLIRHLVKARSFCPLSTDTFVLKRRSCLTCIVSEVVTLTRSCHSKQYKQYTSLTETWIAIVVVSHSQRPKPTKTTTTLRERDIAVITSPSFYYVHWPLYKAVPLNIDVI